jgi:hypothetical protein
MRFDQNESNDDLTKERQSQKHHQHENSGHPESKASMAGLNAECDDGRYDARILKRMCNISGK